MDAKITKQRLSHMLSYDWLKIVAVILGGALFWGLVFTTTATRIQPSQHFGIYNYLGATMTSHLTQDDSISNVFSHEVIQLSTGDVTLGGDEYVYQMMEARLVTNDVDVIFTPDVEGSNLTQYQKELDGEVFTATYLEDFLSRYMTYAYRLDGEDGYLAKMEKYLNGYYNGDYRNGELNAEKIENDFRAFVSSTKDKRYKNEQSISLGVQGELKRIAGYRTALIDFYSYLDAGYISLTQKTLYKYYDNAIHEFTGVYSINLCPNEKMEELKKDVYYRATDEESQQTKTTALNMNLVLINDGSREGFEFESLAFINKLVQKHCVDLNQN